MRIQTIILALSTAIFLASCTTFSLPRHDTLTLQSDISDDAVFQRGAQAFQNRFRKAGWLRETESESRAQAVLSIFTKGWAKAKGKSDTEPKDAVSLYLARLTAQAEDNPAPLVVHIKSDLVQARTAMVELNALAEPLLKPEVSSQTKGMRANVMLLERALLSARKAQSLFTETNTRISDTLDETGREEMVTHLAVNAAEVERMKSLVDALNTLRLSNNPTS